jgi:hypothetical protein
MAPAGERLESDGPSTSEVDDSLVEGLDFAGFDRRAQRVAKSMAEREVAVGNSL